MAKKLRSSKISLTLIITVLTIIGGIIGAVEFIYIKPLQSRNDELSRINDASKNEIQQLSLNVEKLQESYKTVTKEVERPLLLTPIDGSSIIGYQVKFEWKHDTWNKNQDYILEIRKIDKSYNGESNDDNFKRFKVSDLDPEHKVMFFPISKIFSNSDGSFSGEYLWRIKPGNLVIHEEKKPEGPQEEARAPEDSHVKASYFEVLQGEASHFNSFKIYPSVIERMERTGKLLVGTSPTLISGHFSVYNIDGTIEGFDIDLINWIAGELGSKLKFKVDTDLKVEIIDVPFRDLLHKLRNDEFDVVISSLTSTVKRETEGLKFTEGYFKTHQIFITSKSNENNGKEEEGVKKGDNTIEEKKNKLIDELKEEGVKVGARAGSTNLKAAQYLSCVYGFQIIRYNTYHDIYKALKDQAINYGLVDDVLVEEELERENGDLEKIEMNLDGLLKGFYSDEYDRLPDESDVYAIAVMDNDLRNEINTILKKVGTVGIRKWIEKQGGRIEGLREKFKDEIVGSAGH